MFTLNKTGQYFWPVEFSFPTDGGKHEKANFDVQFKRLSQSKLQELLEKVDNDKAFCREVMTDWKGVQSESGEDVPFSQQAMDELMDVTGLARKIVETYISSLSESKRKN